jgi:hypothetical protein
MIFRCRFSPSIFREGLLHLAESVKLEWLGLLARASQKLISWKKCFTASTTMK